MESRRPTCMVVHMNNQLSGISLCIQDNDIIFFLKNPKNCLMCSRTNNSEATEVWPLGRGMRQWVMHQLCGKYLYISYYEKHKLGLCPSPLPRVYFQSTASVAMFSSHRYPSSNFTTIEGSNLILI